MSHYLISEASRLVDEESHVLRYWEEELALKIPRNDLGHRYYTEVQLEIFRTIKNLKQQGYQLKEIKQYLEKMEEDGRLPAGCSEDRETAGGVRDEAPQKEGEGQESPLSGEAEEDSEGNVPLPAVQPACAAPVSDHQQARMQEFRELMTDIFVDAMEAGLNRVTDEISDQVSSRVIKEVNYLDREREEREEDRFKALDEAIRSRQWRRKYRAEAAATTAAGKWKRKKKRGFGER